MFPENEKWHEDATSILLRRLSKAAKPPQVKNVNASHVVVMF
jgi:hypothetical protein